LNPRGKKKKNGSGKPEGEVDASSGEDAASELTEGTEANPETAPATGE
jgi:hypothetical protein